MVGACSFNSCDSELRLGCGHHYRGSRVGEPQQQRITIFYNGQICVFNDITNIQDFNGEIYDEVAHINVQATTIISMAMQEMEDGKKHQHNQHERQLCQSNEPSTPRSSTPVWSTPAVVLQDASRRRSLQRFLQMRRARIGSSIPYKHGPQLKDPSC